MNQQGITRPNGFVWNDIPVVYFLLTPLVKVEQCSETSSHEIHMPWNHPKERIQHSQHGESLKSRMMHLYFSTATLQNMFLCSEFTHLSANT
jgi:hypothetical protein